MTVLHFSSLSPVPGAGRRAVLERILPTLVLAWQAMIIIGQRQDGRWSETTITIGRLGLVLSLLTPLLGMASQIVPLLAFLAPGPFVRFNVFHVVWLVRSARELTGPGAPAASRGGPSHPLRATLAAAVLLPLLVVIQPEETPRLTYGGGWEDECAEWTFTHRRYGDTGPRDREKAFLCHARARTYDTPSMFPDTLPDQYVLSYGRHLCAASGGEEREALLARAGSARGTWGADPKVLVFLCPEAMAAREPGLPRSEAEVGADEDRHVAASNARCADPWPGLRARRQGTAAYFLFEGGGYYVYDAGDETSDEGAFEAASDDGFVGSAGSSAAVVTYGENEPMCLTVKAFGSVPPPRLKGWDQVAEVGIVSRSGHLGVPEYSEGGDEGAGAPLPNLAVKGAGRYRLRVYARESAEFEEHLVVVFPGRSTRKIVYRPVAR